MYICDIVSHAQNIQYNMSYVALSEVVSKPLLHSHQIKTSQNDMRLTHMYFELNLT